MSTDRLAVQLDELEHKATVHEGHTVIGKEGQAGVEALHQAPVLHTVTATNMYSSKTSPHNQGSH